MLVGPVALSRACYVFCGCCTDRVEGCGTSIAGPVAPWPATALVLRVAYTGFERNCHGSAVGREGTQILRTG